MDFVFFRPDSNAYSPAPQAPLAAGSYYPPGPYWGGYNPPFHPSFPPPAQSVSNEVIIFCNYKFYDIIISRKEIHVMLIRVVQKTLFLKSHAFTP